MKRESLIDRFRHRYANRRDRPFMVGRFAITLPAGHPLDRYQRQFLNYDRKLPIIAGLVANKYRDAVMLDIGANIGDTAAALRSSVSGPILCVEGNPAFLPYLRRNLADLPGTIRVVERFVGPDSGKVPGYVVATANGTAQLLTGGPGATGTAGDMVTIEDLLLENSDLGTIRLLKTDTDGFDFSILQGALDSLAATRPVLFFEFDPLIGSSSPAAALQAIDGLIRIGYRGIVVYDNFGNYMLGTGLTSTLALDLVANSAQRKRAGGGIAYFDLCCFAPEDEDLFTALVGLERGTALFR